jgi:hypothetical protein
MFPKRVRKAMAAHFIPFGIECTSVGEAFSLWVAITQKAAKMKGNEIFHMMELLY